jgi:DtxR family transcriptional regulator, Mn-dependent transcriptional regulator
MSSERASLSLTASQEDYLKQIFLLGERGASVGTQSLALRLGIRPASVTGMVHRLAEIGLVDHRRYHGVTLTESGRQVALEMLRRHRLLETYLSETLGYGWAEIHDEAERLEHVISERFEERIAEALGHPTRDPHGDPIPDAQLRLPEDGSGCRLAERAAVGAATVLRVGSQDPDSLAVLARLGLVPGARLEVLEHSPAGVRIGVGRSRFLVPSELAAQVWVEGGEP